MRFLLRTAWGLRAPTARAALPEEPEQEGVVMAFQVFHRTQYGKRGVGYKITLNPLRILIGMNLSNFVQERHAVLLVDCENGILGIGLRSEKGADTYSLCEQRKTMRSGESKVIGLVISARDFLANVGVKERIKFVPTFDETNRIISWKLADGKAA